MPIINKIDKDKEAWRIRMRKEVCDEIIAYCEWAEIKYKDYFIEEACKYIFLNDKDWIKHKKTR